MFTPADRLNWANVALMVVSCVAAVIAPFHVFLFAYAVLGPLHYLTEISWLHDRSYFTPSPSRRRGWLMLVSATALVMIFSYVRSDVFHQQVSPLLEIGMFLLVFAAAGVASFVRHPVNAAAIVGLAMLGILMFSAYPAYGILAYLLMTVLHVFVFTGVFILTGAMKTNSRSGYVSLAVFVLCAAAAWWIEVPAKTPAESLRAMYAMFDQLNGLLLRIDGATATGVMRFIAFAYLYHYLNWFSKTSIIRWHEVSRARAIALVSMWLGGVALYAYSYQLGFAVFYVLSVLHVMLEFPLNHQSFVVLFRSSPKRGEARNRATNVGLAVREAG